MSTLKDVAAHAGVSVATVSCCLSGAKPVKDETKNRIMEAIEVLKYIPNASARNLKLAKTNRIGIILPDMNDIFWSDVLKGISDSFQQENYDISIAFSYRSPHVESSKILDFISQNISGLLLVTCQPNHMAFFSNHINTFSIPAVFMEEKPANLNCNYIGFDNYKTVCFLTERFITSGYQQLALITGPKFLSSQSQCIDAFTQTLQQHGFFADSSHLSITDGSKEDSFKSAMTLFHSRQKIQAIFTTGTSMAAGILEAAAVVGILVPQELKIITLGEESWDMSSRTRDIFATKRNAYTLGEQTAQLLKEHMAAPDIFHKKVIMLEDEIINNPFSIPTPPSVSDFNIKKSGNPAIRILACDLSTSEALTLVSHDFTKTYGIDVAFEIDRQNHMFHRIVEDCRSEHPEFDLYMSDIIWMDYLAQNHYITDMTDFIKSKHFHENAYISPKMETCYYKDRCYGLPIIGGSQILFYRKDLFDNTAVQKQYQTMTKQTLNPPINWAAFNQIASFFTRSHNPHSPTPFGTSMAGIIDEELAPELFIRLWSYGGNMWDAWNRSSLNSSESKNAFENILETLQFCERSPFETSITQTVEDFCQGKTAMLITYSNYANQIRNRINNTFIGQVGYAPLPGNTPVNVGWNLTINAEIKDINPVYQYFYWLNNAQIQHYLTIMDGQTTFSSVCNNHNLRTLYPWLIFHDAPSHIFKRSGPPKPHSLVIPQNKTERILCNCFRNIISSNISISEALYTAQQEAKHLLMTYGYHSIAMIRR